MAKKETSALKSKSPAKEGNFWFDKFSSMKQDLLCVGILLAIIFLLFGKIIFNNMVFADSSDAATHNSWVEGLNHIRETEHIDPLWMPYLFSGMPIAAALIFSQNVNYLETLILLPGKLLFLNSEMSWFVLHYFLMGLFMYMLARRLGFSPLPSLFAAATLMLHPNAIGLSQSGHGSKLITLSYIPLLFLLTYNLFQKRNLLSLGLLAGVTGTLFLSRHPQIAFYGMMLIGSYLVYELIFDIRQRPVEGVKKALLFVLAVGIGFAIYTFEFLPTQEYSKYSIRGGSETGVSKGLDYDYATNWSFHPLEALTYIVPSTFGFSDPYVIDVQGQEQPMNLYWGWMPFTDCPVYIGIIPVLLGLLALVHNRDKLAWFLALFSGLILLISFGKYLSVVYDLFFNFVPYFNKFRAPVLILYLMPITFGLLAANGMSYIGDIMKSGKDESFIKIKKRMMFYAMTLTGAVVLGFIGKSGLKGFLSGFMFSAPIDQQVAQQYGREAVTIFHDKRFEVFWNYFVWCALQGALFFGLITLYWNGKLQRSMMMFGIIALVVVDLYTIDTKYINPTIKSEESIPFRGDATVQRLQSESDTSLFRVFPTWGLDNSLMNYHIQMITGYSPAKLKIYQETVDSCFSRGNRKVFDMLNVKYFLGKQKGRDGNEQVVAQLNPEVLPRAWFVDSSVVSLSKKQTFYILNSNDWDPKQTAILEKEPATKPGRSQGTTVTNIKFASSDITLSATTPAPALLVLSEIYYPAGWKAYIDGVETEIYKTNYILRSVIVPAGTHQVEWKFEPSSFQYGMIISRSAWGLTGILVLIGLVQLPVVREKFGKKKQEG
jgi:hypothetical protein